jgi:ADP-ribose pyrophosphatase
MQFNESSELKRLGETAVSTEDIFDGVILHVKRDMVRLSNGSETVREVIRHIGAVCVIPVTDDNRVIMERQFRYPLNRVILEIPAGKLDAPDEDRLSAIKRELREETGYSAEEWTELGDFHPAPAYSDEYITMYLARGLHKGERDLDEDEFLDVYPIPLADLVQDVMEGRISDAKTQVCILKAARILGV